MRTIRGEYIAVVATLVSLAVSSCAPAQTTPALESPVLVTLDKPAYSRVDTVHVTITNSTDRALLFSTACDLFIDESMEGEWTEVYRPDCTGVRVIPTRVAAHRLETVDFHLVGSLPDDPFGDRTCRLRLRYQIEETGHGTAMSVPFAVLW